MRQTIHCLCDNENAQTEKFLWILKDQSRRTYECRRFLRFRNYISKRRRKNKITVLTRFFNEAKYLLSVKLDALLSVSCQLSKQPQLHLSVSFVRLLHELIDFVLIDLIDRLPFDGKIVSRNLCICSVCSFCIAMLWLLQIISLL